MSSPLPGLSPREGAEPNDPSDRTWSELDIESVLSKASAEGIEGMGSLICKNQNRTEVRRREKWGAYIL